MELNKVTVLTATYNRSHLLPGLYRSILNSTYKNLEWLIIDDGSTDKTKDLIATYKKESLIEINYIYQENKGKHVALNKGFSVIQTELLIIIDSDDEFTKDGIEMLVNTWDSEIDKKNTIAVVGNDIDKSGKIIGTEFPKDKIKSTYLKMYQKIKVKGDKAYLWNFKILEKFRFPVFENEFFLTEAILWERLGNYNMIFINKNIFKVEYLNTGLSSNSLILRIKNIKGTLEYYSSAVNNSITLSYKIKNTTNLLRFCLHSKTNIFSLIRKKNAHFLFFSIPISIIFFIKDKYSLMHR